MKSINRKMLQHKVGQLKRLLVTQLARHPLVNKTPEPLRFRIWQLIAVNNKQGFVYIRIPKAANSTISKTLVHYSFPDIVGLEEDRTGSYSKSLFGSPDLGTFTYQKLLEKYFVFSFFRNPYTRTLSAFLDKLAMDKFEWVSAAAGTTKDVPLSFAEFVEWLEKDNNVMSNKHWAPQTTLCIVPPDELHFTGFIEDLDSGLDQLRKKLFPAIKEGRISTREHGRQNSAEKLEQYYTPDIQQRIYNLYRKDFELLGYPFDIDKATCPPMFPPSIRNPEPA